MIEVLALLNRWKFPGILVEMMSLIYRFLFVLLEVAGNMMTSQHSRWGYADLRSSFRSLAGLISNVFTKAYHQAMISYQAMEARCYEGEFKLICWDYSISLKNIICIIFFETLLLWLNLFWGLWY